MHISTAAVHAAEGPRVDGSAVHPIFQSSTFTCEDAVTPGVAYGELRYTRCNNNPSQVALARKIAVLECSEAALVTGSGMAAINTTLMTFLGAGDHLLVQKCLYGGTYTLVHEILPRMGVEFTELDINDPDSWPEQVRPNTKMIYVETISNPMCGVPDLPAVVRLARAHGLLSCIDNTFASPVNFRPITHGFDLVVESVTKYLNGHSDLIAGCVAGSHELIEKVLETLNHMGGMLDPHACFLVQRGIKTLGLRVARQNENTLALATALQKHPAVASVHYPGLPSHPQHELAQSLFKGNGGPLWHASPAPETAKPPGSNGLGCNGAVPTTPDGAAAPGEAGYGGVFSVELHGGLKAGTAFIGALKLALFAPSLGGVETLVVLPATSSHAGQTPAQRAALGITDGLVRVAVGIEDTQDLLEDFLQAADEAAKAVL